MPEMKPGTFVVIKVGARKGYIGMVVNQSVYTTRYRIKFGVDGPAGLYLPNHLEAASREQIDADPRLDGVGGLIFDGQTYEER